VTFIPGSSTGLSFYGTTTLGGSGYDGVVFQMTYSNGAWSYSEYYGFSGDPDGFGPVDGVTLVGGVVYTMTTKGGSSDYGAVISIQ